MALDLYISRLAKLLVDSGGASSFDEAQHRLRALTLEVVVGTDARSPAAHAAILTAVSVGRRTFVGGVRVVGEVGQSLNCSLPIDASSLGEAAAQLGATVFDGVASRRVVIGTADVHDAEWSVSVWWSDWKAGIAATATHDCSSGENPLVGIAAGALAVGAAFDVERGQNSDLNSEIDLWPTTDGHEDAPKFSEVFLPGALWLIGLGNLGQAYLWALAALPYEDPSAISLVLQDQDKIGEENWATSVLVRDETYGMQKTWVAEQWALAKGFKVRRIDRWVAANDRLGDDDPRVALSGVDKVLARKLLGNVGFHCIVDAGLGRTKRDFDRYRVTLFNHLRPIDAHFSDQADVAEANEIPDVKAYRDLVDEIGRCGAAEVAGASVAASYVSALAAAIAVARIIAITSGCKCPSNEVGRVSALNSRKVAPLINLDVRGANHAGRPSISGARGPLIR